MDIDENTVRFGIETVKGLIGISKDLTKNKSDPKEVAAKIAEINDGLLSLREELQDSRDYALSLREKNYELEKQLLAIKTAAEIATKYEDENGLLFELDDENKRVSEPFCNHCFVKEDGKKFRLNRDDSAGHMYFCSNCREGRGTFLGFGDPDDSRYGY